MAVFLAVSGSLQHPDDLLRAKGQPALEQGIPGSLTPTPSFLRPCSGSEVAPLEMTFILSDQQDAF